MDTKISKQEKMRIMKQNLSKKEFKKLKYGKAHKDKFLKINEMHLKQNDPLHDLEKLKAEQIQSEKIVAERTDKVKTVVDESLYFGSPIPDSRLTLYKLLPKDAKAYVRLVTNFGNLNLELYAGLAPKTVDNFLLLCKNAKYDQSVFHRIERGSLIQGGKSKTNQDKSFWGSAFEDEVCDELKHFTRGIVSMANKSQPNTNNCQFVITCRKLPELDYKHSVFGKVVGGKDVLSEIEQVDVTKIDHKPIKDVTILQTIVYTDPFEEVLKQIEEMSDEENDEK